MAGDVADEVVVPRRGEVNDVAARRPLAHRLPRRRLARLERVPRHPVHVVLPRHVVERCIGRRQSRAATINKTTERYILCWGLTIMVRTKSVAGGEVVLLRPGQVVGADGPPVGVADDVLRRAAVAWACHDRRKEKQ